MWKKRVLYSVVVGAAALGFLLYSQSARLERTLTESLQHIPNVQFRQAELAYFPTPTLILSQPQYHYGDWSVSAERATLRFGWFALLGFSPSIKRAALVGGVVSDEKQTILDKIDLELTDIDSVYHAATLAMVAETINRDKLQFSGAVRRFANGIELHNPVFHAEMAADYFLNNRTLDFKADMLSFSRQQALWQVAARQAQLNRLMISDAIAHIVISAEAGTLRLYLQLDQAGGRLSITSLSEPQKQHLTLSGKNVLLAPLLTFLQLPVLLDGKTDFDGKAVFEQGVLSEGTLQLKVMDTALNGLNLFEMISQYYPIRQGAAQYADRAVTPFNQVNVALDWNRQTVKLKRIQAFGDDLNLNGKGEMALTDFTCRLELRLLPTMEGYAQYQLPVSLFGPCRSPQYRINVDKKLSNQLKQLLREKLKEKN
ncbi:hypothetical protein A1D23_12385 [Chelonobacter oris]|uniref:hypothetical protein n=1 Tax=Chelonobacter oris TaxID=505317 RepID=UPI00244B450F|nr:hypothetical protein [Chelonobacter oris]MDH3001317.1 hypothetical protein [Chelonobacter oris]